MPHVGMPHVDMPHFDMRNVDMPHGKCASYWYANVKAHLTLICLTLKCPMLTYFMLKFAMLRLTSCWYTFSLADADNFVILCWTVLTCWHVDMLIWRSVRSCSQTIPEKVRNSIPINMGFMGWGWLLWWSWVTFKPFRYKKFNRRAQTVNFSVLSRRRQELCAENP